jgi:glutathione S-transferase
MTLRIFGIARTRAFRALWVAKELGIPYEHVEIEIGKEGARREDYLKVNPNGRLPAIQDDGFVLWESLAITLYLAKKHGFGRLYPADIEDEARTWQWSLWALNEVDRGVNIWSLHAIRLPPEERDPAKLAEALKVIAAPFRVLDTALADRQFLLGDDFTVVDLNVAAVISRAVVMEMPETPNVAAWLKRCLGRPAAVAALKLREASDAASPPDAIRLIARINRL